MRKCSPLLMSGAVAALSPVRGSKHRLIVRSLSTLVALGAVLPALVIPSLPLRAGAQISTPPNVLIIITDDQRNDGTLGVMPVTRELFGKQGTRFTNTFATTPICCPSRASLFTGQYAHNHQVRKNGDAQFLDQDQTVQAYLEQAGYRNALFGKFFYGFSVGTNPAHFSDWATTRAKRYSDALWNVQGEVRNVEQYSTDFIRDQALSFLADTELDDLRPWFMVLAPQAPHKPFTPAERHRGALVPRWQSNPAIRERDRSDKPRYVRRRDVLIADEKEVRRKQLRSLMAVDEMVGDVMGSVQGLGEDQRTLAFFLSDNGMMWGEHDLASKRHAYTQSVEVPMFARWPGRVSFGGRDPRLVGVLDVAPTILDAADIQSGHVMDGRSLLKARAREKILLEFWSEKKVPTWASIRTRDVQYVEYYRDDGSLGFREYYDLRRDPWQLQNLLHDRDASTRPRVRDLHRDLGALRRCSGAGCP